MKASFPDVSVKARWRVFDAILFIIGFWGVYYLDEHRTPIVALLVGLAAGSATIIGFIIRNRIVRTVLGFTMLGASWTMDHAGHPDLATPITIFGTVVLAMVIADSLKRKITAWIEKRLQTS